jgi:zinc transport system permease protein
MDELLLKALLAGVGVAVVAGPLGCFVVWRRMAYFGDTLAHAALLGVAAAMLLNIDLTIGVIALCGVVAVLLATLERQRGIGSDTLLGILAHGGLALGLVLLSLMEKVRLDLMGWLFGDILAVTVIDVALVLGGAVVVLAALAACWRPLVAMTVDEDLARVEGHAVDRARLVLMLLVAAVVAVAMKVVGVLLITAMLVMPAAAARRFARTPEQMALAATLAGVLAVCGGLGASWRWDIPAGPAVVVAAAALFAVSRALPRR